MHPVLEVDFKTSRLCLFDPAALPPDVDRPAGREPKALDALAAQGRLYTWDLEGFTTLGLWVDAPLPPDFVPHAQRLAHLEAFALPSGRLYFTDAACVFHQDDSALRKHPGRGQSADVPAGVYGFELYALDLPVASRRELDARLTPAERRSATAVDALLGVGCLGLLLTVLLMPWLVRDHPGWALGLLVLGGPELFGFLHKRLSARIPALQKRRQWARERPDYALVLRRRP